jgi:amino acid adenylation domain-containing protein
MYMGAQLPNVPPRLCIYHLLKEQAERTPDALAFAAPGRPPLLYGRLRHYLDDGVERLWAMGVDRHDCIALVLPNGPEMALAFLTVSAVAICVPLNPAYRADEFDFYLTHLPVKALLIQADMASPARDVAQMRAIPLIELAPVPEAEAGRFLLTGEVGVRTTPPSLAQPDDVALGLYTSGTTARPKLVPLTHINVCTAARSCIETMALGIHDCCLNVTPLFHLQGLVVVLLTSMLAGASVVCPPDFSAPQFFRWMDAFHPTWYAAGPTIHQAILEHAAPNRDIIARRPLRFIRTGGAPLLPQTMEELERIFRVPVIQVYGMTEAAGQITSNPLPPRVRKVGSVGVAAGAEVAIMNEAGASLSAGEVGEVVARGPSVMQGYHNNPTANAQSFIGGWFRTGDQGFLDSDGYLFITGRLKEMINRGGEKIAPKEVEDVLMNHPAVAQAVTFAVPDVRLGEDIAAAVVLRQNAVATERDIRQFAVMHLAHFKVPRQVLIVDDIPKGPAGKLQRLSLAEKLGLTIHDRARATVHTDFTAPRTSVEEVLAGLWTQLLHLERVGIHDDFFLLGGDSLLAAQLLSGVRDSMHVEWSFLSFLETPTVAGLAAAIAQHRATQPGYSKNVSALPTIVPALQQRFLPFPLTDVQQAYWVGRRGLFELGRVSSHLYMELACVDVDLERLSLAWQQLIDRHDMLRAIVLPEGQQQILARVPPYQIAVLDLRAQDPEAVTSQLEALRERMSHQVLPSERWPLFEIRATRLDDHRLRLHCSFDALILDAASRFLLFREWAQLYENAATPLAPLEISFRDYVLAATALRDADLYRRSQDYWWSRLPTLPPAPELPLAKDPSAVTHPRFVSWSAGLELEAWLRLKNRASQTGLTPSAVLLAAFAEVLKVWSKSPRFTLNLTYFHRPPLHPQVNDIVGDFTSLILLVVDNSTLPTFAARARHLQEQLWAALDHRYVSGVHVLRELARRQRETTRAAMPVVFTSILPHQSQARDARPMAWLGEVVYRISQTPQVWLDHIVYEEAGALVYHWNAVEELFPEGLLDDLFDAYCRLLQRLADEEETWQDSWPETARTLLSPAQLAQRALVNATEAPVPAGLLHTLFAEQVLQRRQQPAVVSPRRTLTYDELLRRSTQVGHWLRQQGARPNTLVAVVMEKGWEQVVAVLGVLQSGAAYLPIDAELPKERLWYLLEHGEVQLALTQSWLDAHLEWPEHVRRLSVDTANLMGRDAYSWEPVQGPDDLAYVMYTSGSTGLPKGVMIDHRGAVNTIIDINQRFGVGPADRVLALSSLSFDLSVYDIFGTLAAGGTIILPSATATRDPAHWAECMAQEQVTVWNSVPALMEMLVEYAAGRPAVLPHSLRLVLLSGDWIPLTLPDQMKARAEGVQVISLGGATEASIWSILYPIETVDATWKSIPYGKPMVNQRFHVLNEALEPCPVWVPGHLYIGGMGLAKGYWRDTEKTCASFLTHPRTGERLYCTGDLGRYLPDGNIEFLGREDFQVKIQGYRIELGEIEAALTQHPTVRVAVVTAVGEQQRNKRLVAYVVPNQEQTCTVNGLQSVLYEQQRLEDFECQQREGLLLDPGERLAFKLRQPGLREASHRPSVRLTKPELDETLIQTYAERRSSRAFLHQPIPFQQFSAFLSCLCQIELDGAPKYRYASAGSLYPVQTYLYIKPGYVEGLSAGTYYYHPRDHGLVWLSDGAHIDRRIHAPINQSIFDASAFAIFLIGQLSAITPMYGERARDFCLLEAGYMSQHLMTAAPGSHIGLCPVGSLDFEQIRDFFRLEASHVLLHSLLGGRVDHTHQAVRPRSAPASSLAVPSHPALLRPSQTDSALVDELRRFVKEKLPEPMVPSAFVVLDALPLTPNGKVDRKALPAPESLNPELEAAHVAPWTEVEQILATIWQEVLQVERVSVHHNFFDLGGHSLHIVQVYNQLQEVFHRDISITAMFQHPTISSLAKYVSQDQREQPSLQDSQARGRSRRERLARRKRPG